MKKRVLLCNEFSLYNTGYSTYGKELLSKLYQTGKYELAEHASYIKPSDKQINFVPWKVYGNEPENKEEKQIHDSTPCGEFGAWKFEQVVLDFRPDVILSFRDNWMDSHIANSPFRKYYKWIYMPTVDSEPQMEDWLDTINKADAVFTYNDWSFDVLKRSGVSKLVSSCPSSTSEHFKPIPDAKAQFGLKEVNIVGMVGRNQRRKLFPNLFSAFRKYLDISKCDKTYLYCHTSYPDAGWDFAYWIKYFNISTRVLFTYICNRCRYVYPSLFSDVAGVCHKCGGKTTMPSVRFGVSDDILAMIYNTFDLYVQYACAEGLGMPQIEAAACSVPIASVDYSAMADVVRKLKGYPIDVLDYYYEPESQMLRAIPDENDFADYLRRFFKMSNKDRKELKERTLSLYKEHYQSWDVVAKKWADCIDNIGYGNWNHPSRYHRPPTKIPENLNNYDFVRWVISEFLGEPELVYSYMATRMLRDLNAGFTNWAPTGYFFNENSIQLGKPRFDEFNREKAINHFAAILEKKNFWEEKRCTTN